MEWGFVWLMLILKIPIIGLFWIIWWAIKDAPQPELPEQAEGGPHRPIKPRPIAPLRPRRGPHMSPGADRIPSPPRTRTTTVRARVERD